MPGSNLPKAILSVSPPAYQEEVSTTLRLTRYFEIVRTNGTQSMQDMHQNRLKSLRKELDFLKETEWKYKPIEKYIGL